MADWKIEWMTVVSEDWEWSVKTPTMAAEDTDHGGKMRVAVPRCTGIVIVFPIVYDKVCSILLLVVKIMQLSSWRYSNEWLTGKLSG